MSKHGAETRAQNDLVLTKLIIWWGRQKLNMYKSDDSYSKRNIRYHELQPNLLVVG